MTYPEMSAPIASEIISAIRSVVGTGSVVLHEPSFSGNEWLYVKETLDSTFVSSVGKYVDLFEDELARFTGSKYAVAVSSGTAALHVALQLAGVQPADEVLIPALTFAATASAVVYCGAFPHFVDSEPQHLGIDVEKLSKYLDAVIEMRGGGARNRLTGNFVRAVVPMHTFGHPVAMAELVALAEKYNIRVVEDAAESLGSYYRGQHTGTIGLLGTLSFNGNKTITTGGGGAILTSDPELACLAKHLTTTAKLPHRWEYKHDRVGYNYRLPNINAALGCAQLEQLPMLLAAKRELYFRYRKAFADISGVTLLQEPKDCMSNYWLQTILLDPEVEHLRDEILRQTNEAGLMTRPAWTLLNELEPYGAYPTMNVDGARAVVKRLINIPSSANLVPRGQV